MKLSETNEKIKADLMKFVNGEFDSYFSKEQLKFATELSFLLNHISSEGDSIIFKYNNDKLKISGLNDNPYITEEEIFHTIKNEDIFKKSYKSFLREHKLNKLLNE
jgi:hypothetical protein